MTEVYIISATSCYVYSDDGYCGGKLYTEIAYNSEEAAEKLLKCMSDINEETSNCPSDLTSLVTKDDLIKEWKTGNIKDLEEAIDYCKQYVTFFKEYLRSFEFYNPGYDIQVSIIILKDDKTVRYDMSAETVRGS